MKVDNKIVQSGPPVAQEKSYNSSRLTHKEIGCSISLWKSF